MTTRLSFERLLTQLFHSPRLPWKASRIIFITLAFVLATKTVVHSIDSLQPPLIYRKDFLQEFLMARALMEGVNPYLKVSELQHLLLNKTKQNVFPHPSPHPPVIACLSIPLGFMSYEQAATAWLILELALLLLITSQIKCFLFPENANKRTFAIILLFLLGSRMVYIDLLSGQFGLILLELMMVFVFAMQNHRLILAGLCLGVSLSLKFFGLPIFIYLCVRKLWLACSISLLVFFALNLGAMLYLGSETFITYYTEIAPSIVTLYLPNEHNQSLLTIGHRFFIGLYPLVATTLHAPPLFNLPFLAEPTRNILFVAIIWCTVLISKKVNKKTAVPMVVVLSALVSPVAWVHGFVVCIPAVLRGMLLLHKLKFRKIETSLGIILLLGLYFSGLFADNLIGTKTELTFFHSLVTLTPMLTVCGLLLYLVWLERSKERYA